MAGLTSAGLDAHLDGFTAVALYASLHTADPGTSGTAELSAGSYTREVISWASASNGTAATDAQIVFDVPPATISFLGYWSASSGGTFYGSRALDVPQTYATTGTYTIASGNLSESLA